MAKYRITGPDGAVYEVNAPEDATDEQVLAYVRQNSGKPKKTIQAPKQPEYDPTDGMSGPQLFAAGVGKSIYDTGRGIKQLTGGMSRAEVDEQRKLDAPLMRRGAGMAGNITGTVAQVVTPGAMALRYASAAPKVAGAVRAATLPTTIAGNAAQGAVIGAVQPVGTGDSRMVNAGVGGVGGAAGSAIPKGLGALYRGTGSYIGKITPIGVDRRAARILLAESQNPQALMNPQPSAIPGVQRTLAEETLDPGIARLERNARSTGRGFDQIDRANNAARIEALRGFAGDEAQIAALEASRDQAASPLLRMAMQANGVDTSRLLSQLDRAVTKYEGRPAVQQTLKDVQSLLTRPATAAEKAASPNWPDMVPRDELSQLYNVRKTLGDLMSGKLAGEKPHAQAATRELIAIRNGLDRVMTKASPEFGQYLDTYRQGSRAVNRAQLGQQLIEGSGGNILDPVTGLPTLTPASFGRNANNLDAAAAKATGFRKARAESILEPQDLDTIRAVQDDLNRRSFAATAGSGGNSQTFERMAMNDRLAGGFASRIPFIGRAVEYLGQIGETRLQAKLGEMLADPSRARAILANLPDSDRRIVEDALRRVGGTTGAVTPAIAE